MYCSTICIVKQYALKHYTQVALFHAARVTWRAQHLSQTPSDDRHSKKTQPSLATQPQLLLRTLHQSNSLQAFPLSRRCVHSSTVSSLSSTWHRRGIGITSARTRVQEFSASFGASPMLDSPFFPRSTLDAFTTVTWLQI